MSIFDFFTSQGTATPSPEAERGDWIDWYLNREGPAGRFRGSRRPRYGINYLFNGGGSVKSKPSRNIGSDRFVDVGRPRSYPQDQSPMDSGLFSVKTNDPLVNEMKNNYTRTSIDPMTWPGSQYFGIGGYDFVKDRDPTDKNLAFFQLIKDKDARERDAGFHPYGNPRQNIWGGDYMMDLFGGKGTLGFRGDVDDDKWNAYAKWGIEL